jgi:hypothetical protein
LRAAFPPFEITVFEECMAKCSATSDGKLRCAKHCVRSTLYLGRARPSG